MRTKIFKYLIPCCLLFANHVNAQQKIKSAGIQMIINAPVLVNPRDTLFLRMYNENASLPIAQFFTAMPEVKIYSEEEIKLILTNIDKMWNPDKYFDNQDEYNAFVKIWTDELAEQYKRNSEAIQKNRIKK